MKKTPKGIKKRSAKQLANDKRLGRMAKKRAADARRANPKRKRKVAKRKKRAKRRNPSTLRARQTAVQRATNPKRKKSTSSGFYVVFRCKKSSYGTGVSVTWLGPGKTGVPKFGSMSRRFLFQNASAATDMAKKYSSTGFHVGVATRTTTGAMIMKYCREQAKGKA